MKSFSDPLNSWIQNQIGPDAVVEHINELPGSTSAELYDLTVLRSGIKENLVLRLFTLKEWLDEEPDLALHEAHALKHAIQTKLPTPQIIGFDEDGRSCGTPAVLMTKLEGKGNLKPKD
ncbi:MAG TPA: phosphotransferase, partial [Bacillales bacterium]|nr:phosphotransferase [Bacillales bacterium]